MYVVDSWDPWDDFDFDENNIVNADNSDTKKEPGFPADEYVDKTEEASLVERMMGSIVRQAVEGGGELLKTWMNRKTGN